METPCLFSSRFVRQQSRMDTFTRSTGHPARNRWLLVVRQVRPGPPLPHRFLHAGGEPRGRQVQKGDCRRRPELPPSHPRRRRTSRTSGRSPFPRTNSDCMEIIIIKLLIQFECDLTHYSRSRLIGSLWAELKVMTLTE
jgi:hypothetical protein